MGGPKQMAALALLPLPCCPKHRPIVHRPWAQTNLEAAVLPHLVLQILPVALLHLPPLRHTAMGRSHPQLGLIHPSIEESLSHAGSKCLHLCYKGFELAQIPLLIRDCSSTGRGGGL